MEFKSLKNIETSFRQIRTMAIAFVVLCALVTGYALWSSYSFAEKQREKIYVLDNGKSLILALSQDLSQNRPVEAREHGRGAGTCQAVPRTVLHTLARQGGH